MKRKKFIKNCMAIGICRNAANYLAKCKSYAPAKILRMVLDTHQVINCREDQAGAHFRFKLRKEGGGND